MHSPERAKAKGTQLADDPSVMEPDDDLGALPHLLEPEWPSILASALIYWRRRMVA